MTKIMRDSLPLDAVAPVAKRARIASRSNAADCEKRNRRKHALEFFRILHRIDPLGGRISQKSNTLMLGATSIISPNYLSFQFDQLSL